MVHAIGSGEIWRDKVEIDGKKGEKVERKKEKGKMRERMGS